MWLLGMDLRMRRLRTISSQRGRLRPVLATACEQSLGETIFKAVQATREVVNHNTNLGIILLLGATGHSSSRQAAVGGDI